MISDSTIENGTFAPSILTRASAGAAAAGVAVGAVFLAVNDPTRVSIFPVCPLLAFTGFACPGCGLTRGFHALFNGEFLTALEFNLLLPVWAVIISWFLVSMALVAFRGRGLRMPVLSGRAVWITAGVLLTFGVLRNLPWYPFTVLFP